MSTTTTEPVQPAPVTAAAATAVTQPSDREANLRAELAAERVAKNALQGTIASLTGEINTLKETIPATVTAEVGKVTAKLTQLQERLVGAEIKAAAAGAGLVDMDLLPLLDKTGIKLDDNNNVVGVTEAFEALKGKKPEWFKPAATATTTTTQTTGAVRSTGAAAPPAVITAGASGGVNIGAMSKAEYATYKANLLKGMRTGATN